jgi:hypothetical protein
MPAIFVAISFSVPAWLAVHHGRYWLLTVLSLHRRFLLMAET